MDLKDWLLKDSTRMLSHAISSEGGGEEELTLPIATVAGHMFHPNSVNWNSAYLLHELSERPLPLQPLLPALAISMSDTFGDIDYNNKDGVAIAHEIEADNNLVKKLKSELSAFAEDQKPGPGLLAERAASGKSDVNAPMVAVIVEEHRSAMIQVNTQVSLYKGINSQEGALSKYAENPTKKTKSTKSSASTSAGAAPAFGTIREGPTKRVRKRPAKFEETTPNPSRNNSVKVNTNHSEEIFQTANEPNLNALKARESRKKKKIATIALQSENKSMEKVNVTLKLEKKRLISELEKEKKLTAAIFGLQRVFPTVVQPIKAVLMALMGENGPAGDGGEQREIQTPEGLKEVSSTDVNNEIVLHSVPHPHENIASES